ncbi:hypothetical protein CRYUN_Cryun18bG0100700 [Craigia yunnanensis]
MSLINDTKKMLLGGLLLCEKKALPKRRNRRKQLEQIEAKAKRSYQKDVASFEARDSNAQALDGQIGQCRSSFKTGI